MARRRSAAHVAKEIKRIYRHEIPDCTDKEAAFLLGVELGIHWYFGLCIKSAIDILLWWRTFGRKSPLDYDADEMFPSEKASDYSKWIFEKICAEGLEEIGPTAAQIKANKDKTK